MVRYGNCSFSCNQDKYHIYSTDTDFLNYIAANILINYDVQEKQITNSAVLRGTLHFKSENTSIWFLVEEYICSCGWEPYASLFESLSNGSGPGRRVCYRKKYD